jgi:hypothetical protein
LERRIRTWRALHGAEREIIFRQEHPQLDLPTRLDAAKAVAPYTNPRLAVIDSTVRAKVEVSGTLSADEMRARARAAIAEAFAERPLAIEHEPRVIAGRDVAKDVEDKSRE